MLAYMGPGNEALEGKTVGPYSTEDIITWQSGKDECLFMTDAWVEDFGVQNPAVYDCFPKFIRRGKLVLSDGSLDKEALKTSGHALRC